MLSRNIFLPGDKECHCYAWHVWLKYAIHDNVEIIHYDFDRLHDTIRYAELMAIKHIHNIDKQRNSNYVK